MLSEFNIWRKSLENNNNTYKFVLALSIIKSISKGEKELTYATIRKDFIEFYWNQALIYKINHSYTQKQIPLVIQKIKELVPDSVHTLPFTKIKKSKSGFLDELDNYLLQRKSILRNPISRFQFDVKIKSSDGDPKGEGWLYSWSDEDQKLIFKREPYSIIQNNKRAFLEHVIYKATVFLERYNFTPRLSEKISIGIERQPIPGKLRSFFVDATNCFYCGTLLQNTTMHLDHFIPWEYVLSHDLWNLVPSCQMCNNGPGGKFISLPQGSFLDKLKTRNDYFFGAKILTKDFVNSKELELRVDNLYEYALKSGYGIWISK